MNLKLASMSDLETVVKLVAIFVKNSPYKNEVYDEDKVRGVVRNLLLDKNKGIVILLMKDDVPVGFIGGFLTEMVFSREPVAAELFWWVDPQYRSRKSLMLKEAFEYWSRRVGAKKIQMSSTVDNDKVARYYERTGYDPFERSFLKRV